MFALSARQMATLFVIIIVAFSKLLTGLFPDLFHANEWLVYQVWTVAIWLFVMFLPKSVGTAFK